ncbi:hypothetical protein KUTeg_019792 [Tegillarca granosa]|uniref:Large ribosomal subunit protein uL3m n=1 Tax=Tegillarca granosa TaxID=220873 RepID=A0ABQ9EDG7_TEGGR|nr:hypothetical protein KUTeg_019792 [Tegillarca granosa]
MAACGVLSKVVNCVQSIILRDTVTASKVLTCYQTVRYRKRSNVPPSWHVKQWSQVENEGLTEENREFVQEMVLDQYKTVQGSPLQEEPWPRHNFGYKTKRCGVLAIKLGTLPQWTKKGTVIYTTVLQVVDNHVIRYTPPEEYMTQADWRPWFKDRFGTGTPLSVNHFRVGDYVDCSGKSIDWGFQGVKKRWGMKGMGRTHGVTKAHNKPGSTGSGRIYRINTKYNLLYIKGHGIPGPVHSFVRVFDTTLPHRRHKLLLKNDPPPMPTYIPESIDEELPEEYFDDELYQFTEPTIVFEEEKVQKKK